MDFTPLSGRKDDPAELLPYVAQSSVWRSVSDALAFVLFVVGFLLVAVAPALVAAAYRWLL